MRKNIIIILIIAVALVFGRWLISSLSKDKTAKQRELSRTPAVTVADVKTDKVVMEYTSTARVTAKYRVEILARISGYLLKSYFKEGDNVKAGQLLFEIEPQQYQYAAKQAKANIENTKAQYEYYQKQLERYKELVSKDYIAKSDYDNIYSQRNAFRAQLDSADSAYRDAQRNLSYTKIKSPVDGKVGMISVTEGNYVSMNSGPLTTINSYDPMYVTFPMTSKDYADLARIDANNNINRKVEFLFSTGKKYEYSGIQDFLDNKVDESTGTITLRATFPNPKNELIHGDFGKIVIYSNNKATMPVVPQTATMENQEGRYLYVLDKDNLPRMSYIKTMGQTDNGNWIVSEGVKAGDRILTSGIQKVVPGNPVRIVDKAVNENSTKPKKINIFARLYKNILNKFKK